LNPFQKNFIRTVDNFFSYATDRQADKHTMANVEVNKSHTDTDGRHGSMEC